MIDNIRQILINNGMNETEALNESTKEILLLFGVSGCLCEWKERVKQLMTGLEAQHIDEFMNEANTQEYLEYGKAYINAVRNKINNR